MTEHSNLTDLIPEAELAKRFSVKVQTLRAWAARRQGPPRVTIARKVYYRPEAIEEWVRSRERDPAASRKGSRSRRHRREVR